MRFAESRWFAPVVFALLTAIVLGDVLIAPAHRVISSNGGDLTMQFVAWRQFGFGELSRGNLPLWNPHIFGGTPYFAGFQSALFYPPNWLHLCLSLARAIDWIVGLHVFAAGYFTYLWCRRRASVIGSIVGGAMFMFSGPYFLHLYAGHLPHNAVIVWIPLILLAIDGIVEDSRRLRWTLLGCAALSMQILAGHPQYVYYTGIAATLYFATSLLAHRDRAVVSSIICFVVMYVAAIGITAVQLFPALAASGDMVRSGGLPMGMAGTFSLPPENFLTALVPHIFGPLDVADGTLPPGQQYFGRAYLWETSLFASVSGLMLAAIGATASSNRRVRIMALVMLIATVILALGRHTLLYSLMYKFVPQYGSFRGSVKFAAIALAFISMLAAIGFDRLRQAELSKVGIQSIAVLVVALATISATIYFSSSDGRYGMWQQLLAKIASARTNGVDSELFVAIPASAYGETEFIRQTGRSAAMRAGAATGVAALAALLIMARRWRRDVVLILPMLAATELVVFARGAVATTGIAPQIPQTWLDALARAPKDVRALIVDPGRQNHGMYFGFDGLWGYDPGVLKRYAELLYFSQGARPSDATQYLPPLRGPSPNIFRALRLKFVFQDDPPNQVIDLPWPPLPTALIVRNYLVIPSRDSQFATLVSTSFDPAATALLESEPDPKPVKGASVGDVEVVSRTTDSLELRVQLDTPAILLVTNNYTPDWTARDLDSGRAQSIQSANWTQQAIALAAGKHHLMIEYSPRSFRVGRWVSALSILAVICIAARMLLIRSRPATD